MGAKSEKIEIDLPQDIIFVMRGMEKPEEVKRKMKMAPIITGKGIFTGVLLVLEL